MGAQGTATLDFGVFPGKADTSVAITGQASITSGSLVEAWIRPETTVDHSADEHLVSPPRVLAGSIVAGTGFTIYGFQQDIPEAIEAPHRAYKGNGDTTSHTRGPVIYGLWTVAWVWN